MLITWVLPIKGWQGVKKTCSFPTAMKHTADELGKERRSVFSLTMLLFLDHACNDPQQTFQKSIHQLKNCWHLLYLFQWPETGSNYLYVHTAKVWCKLVKLSSHGMNHTRAEWIQVLFPGKEPRWLKVGNGFSSPSYFGYFVILHGNCSMLKHSYMTQSNGRSSYLYSYLHRSKWYIHFIGFV